MTYPNNYQEAIGFWIQVHEVVLTSITGTYASGDVLSATHEIPNVLANNACGIVQSILVLDTDDQGQGFDVVLLAANVSLGTVNSAVSISDADARYIVSYIDIGSGDYNDLGGCRVADKQNINAGFKMPDGTSLWLGTISRGTGTYTASGLKLKISILQGM